ncbi:hypothetical protein D3C71_1428970 [compost metagenome]
MLALCVGLEGIGKDAPAFHAMQPFKRPMVAGVARDLDGTNLHPRLSALACTGCMIFKAQFTSGEKQQAPRLALPQLTILLAPALALPVRQHVGHLPGLFAIQLPQFVQAEQGIIAPPGDPLDGVPGRSQCLTVTIRVAVDTGGGFHDGGLAVCALALEVKPAPLHAYQREQWGCESQ